MVNKKVAKGFTSFTENVEPTQKPEKHYVFLVVLSDKCYF